jgi:hypothetical protein
MTDVLMLALAFGFFALAISYTAFFVISQPAILKPRS